MGTTRCLTAEQLTVGMTHEVRRQFSHAQIARYCELADDHNAIHHDVEAARLRFLNSPDIVVPGALIQSAITGVFGTEFPGDGSLGLTFEPERMRKPVYPDEVVVLRFEVIKIRAAIVEFKVTIEDETGALISRAAVRVLAPDAAYRAWWEAHHTGSRD